MVVHSPQIAREVFGMDQTYAVPRRFSRIPSESPVLVRKIGDGGLGNFARTKDIGAGGLGIVHKQGIGTGVRLQILLSVKGHLIEAEGRVCYEVPGKDYETRIGVEFVEISPVDQGIIESLVSAHADRLVRAIPANQTH
jgi:hypothetical protein